MGAPVRKDEGSATHIGKPIFVLGSFVLSCSAKVPRFPQDGESLAAEIVTIEPGGKGFNIAVAARRLGARVDGLLAVGDDLPSAFAEPALTSAGLPQAMLLRLPGRTGSGVGFTDGRGETRIAVDAGVNRAISAAHVRTASERIAASAMVTAQFEIADEPIREAFALARRAGIPTLLNPSPFRPVTPDILATTSILIVNETEAAALARSLAIGADGPVLPDGFARHLGPALLGLGPELVVLTRGAEGALALTRDGVTAQPALQVTSVDSLGAGDAFAAALAVALAEGRALGDAMGWAAAAGALTTTRTGVFDALPWRKELESLVSAA